MTADGAGRSGAAGMGGMMDLSTRQRAILESLLGQASERSLAWIAERLGVSARTVHRDLARLAPELSRRGLVLSGRAGLGVQIIGSHEAIEACAEELSRSPLRDVQPEERRRDLAAALLASDDAQKLFALSADSGANASAIRNDLDILAPWFKVHGLELSLKRGLGVLLEGGERGRREALCSLIMEQYGEAGILARLHGRKPEDPDGESIPGSAAAESLSVIVCDDDFRVAESVLAGLLKGSLPVLAPRDYLGLAARLAVAARRRRLGHELGPFAPGSPGSEPEIQADARDRLAATARLIAMGAANAFGLVESEAEAESVYRYLLGAKPEKSGSEILGADIGSLEQVRRLIEACGRAAGHDFVDDRTLRDGLASHWGPALYRLRNGLPIRNPLLAQIRSGYPELFASVSLALAAVFPGLEIPADEAAYLVLHFGSSLERQAKEGGKIRVLVVCSAGIGSAHMLASRIRAELPEIEIVANLSWFDVKDLALDDCDLLVSTIPLPLDSLDYALVDPLLGAEGVRAIRAAMVHMRARRADGKAPGRGVAGPRVAEREDASLVDLRRMSRHLQAVIGILERLSVFPDADPGRDWDGLLAAAVTRCARSGLVRDPATLLGDLRERSRDRGILLPGTRILFLHARSQGTELSSLTLHVLSGPPSDRGAPWAVPPTRLALMLAPRALEAETQDILNEISVSFLDARTAGILQSDDEKEIRAHYTRYLDRYFKSFRQQGER